MVSVIATLSSLAAVAQDGGLIFPETPEGGVTLQSGDINSAAPDQSLSVFVGAPEACCDGRSPLSGRYSMRDGGITFVPAFPLIKGQAYTVLTQLSGAERKTAFVVGEGSVAPHVVAVYPNGPVVPENTLRFYIEFASPMQPHVAQEFIALLDADGIADRAAFMSFKQELWNHDRTRLTLLMDPGRIKRGVAQNLELGPALEEGRAYTLMIKAGWPGALVGQTETGYAVPFDVGPALRERPDPERFEISAPHLNSRDPLVVGFDRAFDRVQLANALTVVTADDRRIAGDIRLSEGETRWVFVPHAPWAEPRVRVVIDSRLEDVAGNNFRETLDHALGSATRDVNALEVTVTLRLRNQ